MPQHGVLLIVDKKVSEGNPLTAQNSVQQPVSAHQAIFFFGIEGSLWVP